MGNLKMRTVFSLSSFHCHHSFIILPGLKAENTPSTGHQSIPGHTQTLFTLTLNLESSADLNIHPVGVKYQEYPEETRETCKLWFYQMCLRCCFTAPVLQSYFWCGQTMDRLIHFCLIAFTCLSVHICLVYFFHFSDFNMME